MSLVHSLVTEVLAHLIDALETAYDKALEVKLSSDTHIHILIERIEMSDEWSCRSATSNILKDRSIHLSVASAIEDGAHSADDISALEECFLHSVVYYEVHIALTVAEFWIIKLIVSHAILILYDRKRLERLGEESEFLSMNRNLTGLSAEDITLHTDEITDVEKLLEYIII